MKRYITASIKSCIICNSVLLCVLQVMDQHQQSRKDILSDYCDGKCYHEHELFAADPVALQLILYYDEVELCNPLGSRRRKHKLGLPIP